MILIERIALDSARGAAARSIGRRTARRALGSKVKAADNPQHTRNVDHTKNEPEENGEAESQLDRGCTALTGDKTRVVFQSIEAFPARYSSASGSMQGSDR